MRKPFSGEYRVSQTFGNDLVINGVHVYAQYGYKGHNGIDFATPTGTPILAPHSGKVIEAAFDANGYGYYLKIENDVEGSVLAHNSKLLVKVGDTVVEGQQVSLSGNTGNSTGAHLHWGYYKFPRNRQNGYGGVIDQAPLLNTQNMPSEMYGKPNSYDLTNKESMKVVIDAFNDFMTPGKYMKVVDSEKIINELKVKYEKQISDVNGIAFDLKSSITGIAVMAGLPAESSVDAILEKIKALKEQANNPVPGTSTPSGNLPEFVTINGKIFELFSITMVENKPLGNYQIKK